MGKGLLIDFSSRTPLSRRGTPRPKVPLMQPPSSASPPARTGTLDIDSGDSFENAPLSLSGDTMIRRLGQTLTEGNGPNPARVFSGKVFVTGATGHLGANLVRRLVADGKDVRVFLQKGASTEAVDGLPVERALGDLRDIESLERAMQGCKQAYHVAVMLSTIVPTPELEREMFEVNVVGTQNLLRVALHLGLERVVVTGSYSAVGYPKESTEAPGDETMSFYPFDEVLPYARTKQQVEHECLKA